MINKEEKMSFEFCFLRLKDKPQQLLKDQIILPLFNYYFSNGF